MKIRQGISLIVLVITIIVMTILAGAIILTLNNSGIINKATDAVEQSNLATVKELTQMAWAEAYARGERTEEGLKAAVDKAMEDNKVDTNKYTVKVTTKGVTVKLKSEQNGWRQDGLVVTNGEVTLQVGDYINYKSGASVTLYDDDDEEYTGVYEDIGGRWQILGASDEGELLILSTGKYEPWFILEETDGYCEGVSRLNNLCSVYGFGKGAIGARSITVEDVNKITGYNPETSNYGKGQLHEYGNEVTYWWTKEPWDDEDEEEYAKIAYTSANGVEGSERPDGEEFTYFNGTEFETSTFDEQATEEGLVKIATLTSSGYEYESELAANSKAYIMLFGEEKDKYYYLASPCILTYTPPADYNYFVVKNGWVKTTNVARSDYAIDTYDHCVRAVVMLSKDIELTGNSTDGWTF